MNNDEFYMEKAINLAKKAYDEGEIPVGAIIVKHNEIIAEGYNQKDKLKLVTKHAELIAIEKANIYEKDWRLCDAIIYTTMEPCPMCASAIQQARIKKVIYGCPSNLAENHDIVYKILQSKELNHVVEVNGGVLESKCSQIIKDFFKQKRAK